EAFLAAKHLISTEPIREVSFIADLKPHIKAIASAPELDRIHRLDLGAGERSSVTDSWALGNAGLELLCNAWLPSLCELVMGYQAIGPVGALALARARWLPQLEVLVLASNPVMTRGVVAMASRLGNLRHLDLHDTAIEDPALQAL